MLLFILSLFCCDVIPEGVKQSAPENGDTLIALWWNLENAFDTLKDPTTRDDDFTPNGIKEWTRYRYYRKMQRLSKGLRAAAGQNIPDFIGVCEVENAQVLDDLQESFPWEWPMWRCHSDSPDARGIDVAVFYNHQRWRLDSVAFIAQVHTGKSREGVWTLFQSKSEDDTIVLVWVHLPSLRQPNERVRKEALDLLVSHREVDLIIGDLNTHPNGPLGIWMSQIGLIELHSIIPWGTYAFGKRWSHLDSAWSSVSSQWQGAYQAIPFGTHSKPGNSPTIKPTFYAGKYYGGASDHLPLFIKVWKNPVSPYIYGSTSTR